MYHVAKLVEIWSTFKDVIKKTSEFLLLDMVYANLCRQVGRHGGVCKYDPDRQL